MSGPVPPLPQMSGTLESETKDTGFKIPVSPGLHFPCPIIFCSTSPSCAALEVFAHLKGQSEGFPAQQLRGDKGGFFFCSVSMLGLTSRPGRAVRPLLEVKGCWQNSGELAGGHCPFGEKKVMIKKEKKPPKNNTEKRYGRGDEREAT